MYSYINGYDMYKNTLRTLPKFMQQKSDNS